MSERPSFEIFLAQAVKDLGFPDHKEAERQYLFNIRAARSAVEQNDISKSLSDFLKELSINYSTDRPDILFSHGARAPELQFLVKPFDSVVEKIYRRTILYNRQYPSPPRGDNLGINNFYTEIDDLIRTKIICRYMDGPQYICRHIKDKFDDMGIVCNYRDLSTEAGYYAWHFYFKMPVDIIINKVIEEISVWVEIQFATQLSDVISMLTHDIYKNRRSNVEGVANKTWKWEPTSREFRSAYLGHGLHLLEGVVQSLKDEVLGCAGASETNAGDSSEAAGSVEKSEASGHREG